VSVQSLGSGSSCIGLAVGLWFRVRVKSGNRVRVSVMVWVTFISTNVTTCYLHLCECE